MPMMTRRALLLALAATPWLSARTHAKSANTVPPSALVELEASAGGRLGVYLLDTGDGRSFGHRADERFAMCSTFKLLLAAIVLREGEAGRLDLDEVLRFGEADMVSHAPVTGARLASGGMRIVELAEATQTTSDNVAANLLIRRLGGPAAVTAQFRALGDAVTRIDRYEPQMNQVVAGDPRDTTTPRAFAGTVARLFTSELLGKGARERLTDWMIATETGRKRLRAGLPADWRAGDKTGTGMSDDLPNRHNDVAIVWPPGRAPLVIAAFYEADGSYPEMRERDNAVLADVGRLAARWALEIG